MAAHRYWRINIPLNSYRTIAEIELHTSYGGPDITTPSTVVTADSQTGSYAPANVVKNDGTSSVWESASSAGPHYITVDLGAGNEAEIVEARIQSYNWSVEHPTSVEFQYSDDGSTFTTANSYTGLTWANSEWKTLWVVVPPGTMISKVMAYAVLSPPPGLSVTKSVIYAVLDTNAVVVANSRPQVCVMT